jgi:hypothetical protein
MEQTTMQPPRRVHFFYNSKGGVGKSHNAVNLCQWHRDSGRPCKAFDADATSATFSSFRGLGVTRVRLMDQDDINPRMFDTLTNAFVDPDQDCHFIVDTGASAFVAVNRYALQMDLPGLIHAAGKTMVINMMLVAGNTMFETLANLEAMAEQMPPQVHIVVWINHHFGRVEDHRGRSFEQTEVYDRRRQRITGIVHLPAWTFTDPRTFGEDVARMMTLGLTFEEVKASPAFGIIEKSRLHRVRTAIYGQLDLVFG